jgi:hypothetical protein
VRARRLTRPDPHSQNIAALPMPHLLGTLPDVTTYFAAIIIIS